MATIRSGRTLALIALAALAISVASASLGAARAGSSCPAGTRKFVHVCIETSGRAAQPYADATATCAALKRRLPTFAELDASRQQPGVDLTARGFEWTGQPLSLTSALALDDAGTLAEVNRAASDAFRCVA